MERFSLPVPDDQNEIRTLMDAGWQLEARFGEEARMVPPPELAKLMGFRDFVRDTERHAVEVAMRDSLDAAWAEAQEALPSGWQLTGVEVKSGGYGGRWMARCDPGGHRKTGDLRSVCHGRGATPAAALRALAAKLRDR